MMRQVIVGIILLLIFSGLDVLLFKSLPMMGLSYGSARPVTMLFALLRGAGLAVGVVLLLWMSLRKRPAGGVSRGWLKVFLAFNLALSAFVFYGFFIEPFSLTTTRLEMPVAGLQRPLRIVQLSDLHIERTTRRERDLVGLVNGLHPDVIVMTGDFLNLSYLDDATAVKDLRLLVSQLHATQGVYAVDGTVEDPPRLRELLAGLDVRILDDEIAPLTAASPINLVGVSNLLNRDDGLALTQLMAVEKPAGFNILLYHTPDLIYDARDVSMNLYLAGHTHGGQVRLPLYGAIVTLSSFGKSFEQGFYHVGGTTMYVSRGIGMEGGFVPRVRFLAPPEVVIVDLVPVAEAAP